MTRNGDNIVLNMPNNVTFDSNSANLKPAGANTLTGVAGMVLKEYEKTAVNVVGYTDSTGSKDLNMRLSQQRADSVASALITQGVAANRIRTTGMGPANPIASNSTAEGNACRTVAWKSPSARCSKRIFISPGNRSAGQNA